jgi:hypothetical protein
MQIQARLWAYRCQEDRMAGKPVNRWRKSGRVIALSLLILVCLVCSGLLLLPQNVRTPLVIRQLRTLVQYVIVSAWPRGADAPVARNLVEQYLSAISQSNAADALQVCQGAKSEALARQIAQWGGAEIGDLEFGAFKQETLTTYHLVQSVKVEFSYRHPGQTEWRQGRLEMLWMHSELTLTIPSSSTCIGARD